MQPTNPARGKNRLEAQRVHQAIVDYHRRRRMHIWLLVLVGVPVLLAVSVMLDMILSVL